MRYFTWLRHAIFFSAAILSADCVPSPAADDSEDPALAAGLELITIPADELPGNVRLIEQIETAALIPVTRNPEVFADRDRIPPIALHFGITDEEQLDALRAAGVALYQEDDPANEIGVYAICFASDEAAEEHFGKFTADGADVPFVRQGAWLLYVWKDDGASDDALESLLGRLRETR